MFVGLVIALIGGFFLSLQNIFNTKVNEKTGSWTATTLILGMGFFASLLIGFIIEGERMWMLDNMKNWYWFSGIIGVGVVICVIQSIKLLGPTYAIAIVLTSQLCFALLWDSLGWLGLEKIPFTFQQLLGVLIIIGGIILFKLGGKEVVAEN
ncbi:DMT family transporter [Psychrobacillus glaciei]|uniref:DMT family transporter n=1 Tax=Psychrobacillus glaciei TaxID=2283160 RepID=A0A5J6SI68_9BACI|nr:DMT family transporter [Psychrobacillus glaciei]QFF97626.1 DMT family transporter [Psychrobacillus glaciei]